jgi:hypothetical protein
VRQQQEGPNGGSRYVQAGSAVRRAEGRGAGGSAKPGTGTTGQGPKANGAGEGAGFCCRDADPPLNYPTFINVFSDLGLQGRARLTGVSMLIRRTVNLRNEKGALRRKRFNMDNLARLLAFGPHAGEDVGI